jgi:hypothetical protein
MGEASGWEGVTPVLAPIYEAKYLSIALIGQLEIVLEGKIMVLGCHVSRLRHHKIIRIK